MNIRLLALLVLVAACTAGARPPDLIGEWELVSARVDGADLEFPVDGAPITLGITATDLGGQSLCNSYGAPYSQDGTGITIGDISSTLIGCEERLMEIEGAYLDALDRVDTAVREGAGLLLTGGGVELRFSPAS
jgi:heat shock protein HslJ